MNIVVNMADFLDIEVEEEDSSFSHKLLTSRKYKGNNSEPGIIVKFVQRDTSCIISANN